MTNSENLENSEKTRTNADRIRSLPDKTIAYIIENACAGAIFCRLCPLDDFCDGTMKSFLEWRTWLESEAEE